MKLPNQTTSVNMPIPHPAPVADFISEKHIPHLKFCYVGNNNEALKYLSEIFQSGFGMKNISEAQSYILAYQLFNDKIPDVIFLDIPLNEAELSCFCAFLKKEKLLSRTPILYNDEHLEIQQKNLLKQNQIIDDAINISSKKIDYYSKILFLKRIRIREEFSLSKNPFAVNTSIKRTLSLAGKRLFDILFSSLAILLFAPLFIIIALALKIESRAPIFYVSLRAGRGYKVFRFYKFRSMVPDADKKIKDLAHLNQYNANTQGPKFFKINNDPRITPLGKILRNTSLDELPQLLNVWKGDMSLVGNRPLPLYEAETLTTNEFVERFMAPAGITGLWQIKKRGKTDMSVEERIDLDISYSRKFSVFYDLKIMASTPLALLQKSNV